MSGAAAAMNARHRCRPCSCPLSRRSVASTVLSSIRPRAGLCASPVCASTNNSAVATMPRRWISSRCIPCVVRRRCQEGRLLSMRTPERATRPDRHHCDHRGAAWFPPRPAPALAPGLGFFGPFAPWSPVPCPRPPPLCLSWSRDLTPSVFWCYSYIQHHSPAESTMERRLQNSLWALARS